MIKTYPDVLYIEVGQISDRKVMFWADRWRCSMNALQYLEATQIDEIASEHQAHGYQIMVSKFEAPSQFKTKTLPYHLTATNCCRQLALEVVERSCLAEERLDDLRTQAHQEGFDSFVLRYVSPPPHTDAQVEALDRELCGYLLVNLLDHLAELPTKVAVQSVGQVVLEKVAMMFEGVQVVGSGVVEVALENGYQRKAPQQLTWAFDFPLNFDIELDHSLRLKHVHSLTVSPSGFYQSWPEDTGGHA